MAMSRALDHIREQRAAAAAAAAAAADPDFSRSRSRSRKKAAGTYDRPHRCTAQGCKKAFTRLEHLRRHALNHQPNQVWTCAQCGATFVRSDLWRRHLRKSHSEATTHEDLSAASVSRSPSEAIEAPQPDCPQGAPALVLLDPLTAAGPGHAALLGHGRSCRGADPQDRLLPTSALGTAGFQSASNQSSNSTHLSAALSTAISPLVQVQAPAKAQVQTRSHALSPDDTVFYSYNASSEHNGGDMVWEPGFDFHYASLTTDVDLGWLFETALPSEPCSAGDDANANANANAGANLPQPSLAKQEAFATVPEYETDPLKWKDQSAALRCRFRMCCAMTEARRLHLLAVLRHLPEFDVSDPVFDLNSMRHGIHLYANQMATEYSILQHRTTFASEEVAPYIAAFYGEEAPPELIWSMITLGWSLRLSKTGHEHRMACQIQRVLRRFVINHAAFTTLSQPPSLWIVQTLFMVLVFARYHSSREDYGFASIFHGVLLDAVRRLEIKSDDPDPSKLANPETAKQEWFKWIKNESIRRIVFQAFILDVQHRVLHGGVMCMTPFELNLAMPEADTVFYTEDCETWIQRRRDEPYSKPPHFLSVLKRFWNSSGNKQQLPLLCPRGSRIIMYGILSIACEMRNRDDNTPAVAPRTGDAAATSCLSQRVRKSFETWVEWLALSDHILIIGLPAKLLKRNCSCMFRLAHTLYEITVVDLQVVAGKEVIEGKRVRASDYSRSKRKVRAWAKEERALVGLSYAASIIQDRLSPSFLLHTHCHHCHWCLFVAGLICWNVGFALSGSTINQDLVAEHLAGADGLARRQCDEYLASVAGLQADGDSARSVMEHARETSGVLMVLIRLLQAETRSGMVEEGVYLLKRLVGIQITEPKS